LLHIFITNRVGEAVAGTTGHPVSGYEAKIVDDDMNELPPGTVGKLAVRGPTGCRYLADSRQSNYVRDGWNLTGDSFVSDVNGRLSFVARSDDMIVSSGYNIAGPEIEAALLTHPAVAECGVVGAPDEARGMIVKAYIVVASGIEADAELVAALQDHVKREIAPYKYPRAIEFVAQLPKTETGKLRRFALRQMAQAGSASSGIAAE
jgi:2-aminobenzoate-CoA ligase